MWNVPPACVTVPVHTAAPQVYPVISLIPLKTSGPGKSLQAEELHTPLMRRYDTNLTSISIFQSSASWCLCWETETTAPHSVQPCQAVFCIVCHQINISLAVRGRETVAPSAHIVPAETHGSPPVSFSGLVCDDKMSICFPLTAPMKCSTECTTEVKSWYIKCGENACMCACMHAHVLVGASVHNGASRFTEVTPEKALEREIHSQNIYSVKTYLGSPEAARQSSHILKSPVVNEAFEELQMPGDAHTDS